MHIYKKYIADDQGNPKEVIIPVEYYRGIEKLLDWDLDEEAVRQLREARRGREEGPGEAEIDPDSILCAEGQTNVNRNRGLPRGHPCNPWMVPEEVLSSS